MSTPQEYDKAVQRIEQLTTDRNELWEEVKELRQRVANLTSGRTFGDAVAEERAQIRARVEKLRLVRKPGHLAYNMALDDALAAIDREAGDE